MKTNELQGAALDWAVARCEGHDAHVYGGVVRTTMRGVLGPECHYSTNWSQGGPIIEREFLHIHGSVKSNGDTDWCSLKVHEIKTGCHKGHGPTPLIAAMRCFVASRLGDTVNIPEELQ